MGITAGSRGVPEEMPVTRDIHNNNNNNNNNNNYYYYYYYYYLPPLCGVFTTIYLTMRLGYNFAATLWLKCMVHIMLLCQVKHFILLHQYFPTKCILPNMAVFCSLLLLVVVVLIL